MSLAIGSIAASSSKEFNDLEQKFKILSEKYVQTLNNETVKCNIVSYLGAVETTPIHKDIHEIRIMNVPEIKWIDYKVYAIFIAVANSIYPDKVDVFKINLKVKKND